MRTKRLSLDTPLPTIDTEGRGWLKNKKKWGAADQEKWVLALVDGTLNLKDDRVERRAGVLSIGGSVAVEGPLTVGGALRFGETTRQMIDLWKTQFGIGVQPHTTYFRSGANFAFYRGGEHKDAELDPGAGGTALLKIMPDGGLVSPKWTVTQVFDREPSRGLPLEKKFKANGGTLVIFASGSGTGYGERYIGMEILIDGKPDGIDGKPYGQARVYVSVPSEQHKAFIPILRVVTGIRAGEHTLKLEKLPDTLTDGNDNFNVTILELPF
jgi:hypothetical protein